MKFCMAACLVLAGSPVIAAETVEYKYDARGRLVQVKNSGGAQADYKFDNADNRTEVKIVNAKSRAVVVPLNGLTVIPIPDP